MADERTERAYKTFESHGESELVVERSRFLGFARPVESVDLAMEWVAAIRKEHYDARHVCYGLRIGHGATRGRLNTRLEVAIVAA